MIDSGETCDPPRTSVGPLGNPCRSDCSYCGDNRLDYEFEQCDLTFTVECEEDCRY